MKARISSKVSEAGKEGSIFLLSPGRARNRNLCLLIYQVGIGGIKLDKGGLVQVASLDIFLQRRRYCSR